MNFGTSALHRPWRALRFLRPRGSRRNALQSGRQLLCRCAAFGTLAFTACHSEPRADLVIVNGNEPESLDPAIVTAVPDMRIAKALFEGLVRLDGKTGRPTPGWAESWEISSDGKVYTFHLRPNAAWSTGEPITSHDVVYSWLRALNPA